MREGASIVEVARQAGHSPTMTLDTYGHVFAELEGAEKVSAEAEFGARETSSYPSRTSKRA